MQKVFKNKFYDQIIRLDLDANQFSLTDSLDVNYREITTITLLGSELKYMVRSAKDSWQDFDFQYTVFNPKYPLSGWIPDAKGQYFDFPSVSNNFYQWLKSEVKEYITEIDSIDKWMNFQFEANIFELTGVIFANNSNFFSDESVKIKTSIIKLKQLFHESFNSTIEQTVFINERLNYLTQSVDRLGKFDWTNTFISIMISIVINMCFDTETRKQFFEIIKKAFTTIKFILGS